jgi:hypothetical protein
MRRSACSGAYERLVKSLRASVLRSVAQKTGKINFAGGNWEKFRLWPVDFGCGFERPAGGVRQSAAS